MAKQLSPAHYIDQIRRDLIDNIDNMFADCRCGNLMPESVIDAINSVFPRPPTTPVKKGKSR